MEKVRVGVVGGGYFGQNHARVYAESLLSELISVVDVNAETAKDVAKKYTRALLLFVEKVTY